MEFIDTHCHIHGVDYELPSQEAVANAVADGVTAMICVGTNANDSQLAAGFVQNQPNCWASVGLHPHDSKLGPAELDLIKIQGNRPKVVAIGECGLDYFYSYSPKEEQMQALRWQFELALDLNLPMIWHVREAFDDFWPIYDSYPKTKGVVHSFSASQSELEQVLQRDLYVGLNGIMTFSNNEQQLAAAKSIPLKNLVLETDAPFLTPRPHRGKVNEPRYVRLVAEFLADLRQEEPVAIAQATTYNARKLFNLE